VGEKLSVLFFLGETVLIVLTICNNLTLTDQNDKSIIHFDNESCQIDKQNCQTEVLYDTAKSLKERRAALNVNQQEMGRLCGVSRQTISLIERGDYSPSVTLALTIAKVCGVAVEEVFYLQEEEDNG
jgi:putative transcriptional regulator